jgi:hypothetical protein
LIDLVSCNQNVAVDNLQTFLNRVSILLELANGSLSELDDPWIERRRGSSVPDASCPKHTSVFGEVETGGGLEGVVDELDWESAKVVGFGFRSLQSVVGRKEPVRMADEPWRWWFDKLMDDRRKKRLTETSLVASSSRDDLNSHCPSTFELFSHKRGIQGTIMCMKGTICDGRRQDWRVKFNLRGWIKEEWL